MEEEKRGVLEDYIKKGLERGFNIGYIKETLIKHGHNPEKVDTAANNIAGMKYPKELKPHIEESMGYSSSRPKYSALLILTVIILLIICSFFAVNYFKGRSRVNAVQSELDEIEELGVSIDDLSITMKTQLKLLKEKDLTIEEKEKIIEEQIEVIEEINGKFEIQKKKINNVLLDIMNRMIGRMSG